jgi:hypothetical protein
MPQDLADWLGVFGFALALLLALFEAWKYRQEKKERVRVDLRFQSLVNGLSSPLIATVVNIGRANVHLDRVELQLGPEKPQIGQSVLSIPLNMVGQGVGASSRGPLILEPGGRGEYFVPAGHPLLPRFAAANRCEMRLVVYSNRGAIAHVSGDKVAPCLS